MIDLQKHLLYITKIPVSDSTNNTIRGVSAYWRNEDHTACLGFYFDGPIKDEDPEEASSLSGEIIAQFSEGLLEENYIRLDSPAPLPETPFWGYKRLGEK